MNRLDKERTGPIFFSVVVSSAPFLFYLEPLMAFFTALPGIYNVLVIRKNFPVPGKRLLLIITILFTTGLAINFRELFSRDAGIPLLIIMSSLKILEIKNLRDELVSCFLSFFILLSLILYSSSLFTTIYMFCSSIVTIAVMIQINSSRKNFKGNIRKSIFISIIAVPAAFILFFFFPRLQGTLWGKKGSAKNISGFATSISPGSVSSLARSNATALRVKYETETPEKPGYFRGIVFNNFNGNSWLPSRPVKNHNLISPPRESVKRAFIILFPTNTKYLLSPDFPVKSMEPGIWLTQNSILYSSFKIDEKKRYQVEYSDSVLKYPEPEKRDLHLPVNSNKRAFKLGYKWRGLLQEQRIEKGLEYFRENNFVYTLNPGRPGRDYIDEFLFQTKKGFCEHFASSFAFLMRSANLPARLVGGYLGGLENEIGEFITVRQSDAHVWCEVWVDGKGWIRIDPTGEAVPERLTQNTDEFLPESDFNYSVSSSKVFALLKPLRSAIDAVNFIWDQKIMGYNFSAQKSFLESLGLKKQNFLRKATIFIFAILFSILIVRILFLTITAAANRKKTELLLFDKFQTKLKKRGAEKLPQEGFIEFLDRIKGKIEEHEDFKNINQFILAYTEIRYGDKNFEKNISIMKKTLKRL